MYSKLDMKDSSSRINDKLMKTHLDDRRLVLGVNTGAAPDVGQAPAGQGEAGHLAHAGADHHRA